MMNLSRMVCNKNETSTQIVICSRNLLIGGGGAEQENIWYKVVSYGPFN